MARIVLVHGAFGGAWIWEKVTEPLEAAGHKVETLDLPGAGDDHTPLDQINLDLYAERICEKLGESPEQAVLVGHSMGGMAVTQAASRCPGRVASLIYIAAFLPGEGQSLIGLTQLPEGEGDHVQKTMVVSGEPPVGELSEEDAIIAFYNLAPPEVGKWAAGMQRAQPVIPMMDEAKLTVGYENIPRSYIHCTRDQANMPALQRRMMKERRVSPVIEIETDHTPHLSAPDELVAAIDQLARQEVPA
jgi:pimeloyl-ACP methyl ester carboxylesterase